MRRVEVYEYQRVGTKLQQVKTGEGTFCAFGVNYQEFESGPGNFSTAIVEMDDGTIKNIDVECVRFMDKGK